MINVAEEVAISIGLVAGYGVFPLEVTEQLKSRGHRVHVVAAREETSQEIENLADSVQWLHVGQIGGMIRALQACGVSDVVMAGKVRKLHLFRNFRPDMVALKSLLRLPDRRDDTIMLEIVRLLAEAGIRVRSQLDVVPGMVAGAGHLYGPKPSRRLLRDVQFGVPQARAIAGLDIGQTLVVQQGAVLAVEAIEGTDEAIRRGGALGSGKATVVKVAKPAQDPRFDVPAIGPDTLRCMRQAGCRAIAVQAGCTLLIERQALAALADEYRITIYGFELPREG